MTRSQLTLWLTSAFLLQLSNSLPAPASNLFSRDDLAVLYIKKDPSVCDDGQCLQALELWQISSPSTRTAPGHDAALVRKLPIPSSVCTLPFTGLLGLGQLTLSMNGRVASLLCYRHPPGTPLGRATEKTALLMTADGSMDTSTRLSWPGLAPFSAVSDDGSFLWLGTSDGKLRMLPVGGSAPADEVVLFDLGPDTPIRHITINGGKEMWLSAGESILRLKTIPRSPVANNRWQDLLAEPEIPIPSTRNRLLPAFGFDDGAAYSVNPRRAAYGHAVAMLPRGGKLYPGNDPYDVVWSQPDAPTTIAGDIAFASHFNSAGTNAAVFGYDSSAGRWTQQAAPGSSRLVFHSGFDVLFLTAQMSRYPDNKIYLFDDRGLPLADMAQPIAQVIATSPISVYNLTHFDTKTRGTDTVSTILAYGLKPHERKSGRFAGVCFAPVDTRLAVPAPSIMPTETPRPTPASSPSSSPGVSRPPASPSVSPSFAWQQSGDLGQRMGPPLWFTSPDNIILLRVGEYTAEAKARLKPDTAFVPLGGGGPDGYGPSGTSRPLDFRNATMYERRLAQPLHIDIISRSTGQLKVSLPLPTKRTATHAACTGSLSHVRMFGKMSLTEGASSLVLVCYDAEAGPLLSSEPGSLSGDIIPDSFFPPPGWNETKVPWKHPRRVIAVVSGYGNVDTRTVLNSDCDKVIISSAYRNPVEEVKYRRDYFYVSTMAMEDAPAEERNKCGQRFVALGSKGDPTYDEPLIEPMLFESSWLFYAGRQLYMFNANQDEQRMYIIGKHRQFSAGSSGVFAAPLPRSSFVGSFSSAARDAAAVKPVWTRTILVFNYTQSYPYESIFVMPADQSLNTTAIGLWDASSRTYSTTTKLRSPDGRPVIDGAIDPLSIVGGDMDIGAVDLTAANVRLHLAHFLTASWGQEVDRKQLVSGLGIGWDSNHNIYGPAFMSGRGPNGTFGDGSSANSADWASSSSWAKSYDDENLPKSPAGAGLFRYDIQFGRWRTVVPSFPCCTVLYASLVDAIFSAPVSAPTPSTTSTPSFTQTASITPLPTSSPPPFALSIRRAQAQAQAQAQSQPSPLMEDGNYCVSQDGTTQLRVPCLSPALPPAAFSLMARGCPSEDALLSCTATASEAYLAALPSSTRGAVPPVIVWPGWSGTDGASTGATTATGARVKCNGPSKELAEVTVSSSGGSRSSSWIFASAVAPLPPSLFNVSAFPSSGRRQLATPSAGDATATITCSLFTLNAAAASSGRAVAVGNIEVPLLPSRFPFFKDLLLFFPAHGGILTSPSLSELGAAASSLNISSRAHSEALAAYSSYLASTLSTASSGSSPSSATALGTFASPEWTARCTSKPGQVATTAQECLTEQSVRAFLYRSSRMVAAAPSSFKPRPFCATVSRAALGVLVADVEGGGAPFSANTTVTVAGEVASVLWVSSDGALLHFQLPPQLCNSNAADVFGCRHQAIVVAQPLPKQSASTAGKRQRRRRLAGGAFIDDQLVSSTSVSCPPFCPQGITLQSSSTSTAPFPFAFIPPPLGGSIPSNNVAEPVLATAPASQGSTAIPIIGAPPSSPYLALANPVGVTPAASSSLGLFFTFACPGFLDPSLDASICRNRSHPLASTCAFGDGQTVPCQQCPANSLCPGGVRAQPLPRYWAASETTGEIILCAHPSSERCLGWKDELGAAQCGKAYDQNSYACLSCARGTYTNRDGECLSCSALFGASGEAPLTGAELARGIAVKLLTLAAAIVGVSAALFLVIWRISVCFKGSSVNGITGRFVDMVIFLVLLVQTLGQVSAQAAAGLPAAVADLFSFFKAFNVAQVTIPSKCLQGLVSPFFFETLGLTFILVSSLAFYLILVWEARDKQLDLAGAIKAPFQRCLAATREKPKVSASPAVVFTVSGAGSPPGAEPDEGAAATAARSSGKASGGGTALMARFKAAAESTRLRAASIGARSPAVKACCRHASFFGKNMVRLLTVGLMLLYSPCASTVFASLDCFPAVVTVQQAAALEGVTMELIRSALASPTGVISVNLLRSNPSFLCYRTQHHAAAALAWIVLFAFLVGFPAVLLVFAAAGLRKAEAKKEAELRKEGESKATDESKTEEEGFITSFLLRHMIVARKHYFREIEMLLLFALALLDVFGRHATSAAGYSWVCAVTWLFLLGFMAVTLVLRPYTPDEAWRGPMRAVGLALSCLVALINTLNRVQQLLVRSGTDPDRAAELGESVSDLGIVLIVAVAFYLVTLVLLIARSLLRGAWAEAFLKRAAAAKRKASQQKGAASRGTIEGGAADAGGMGGKRYSAVSINPLAAISGGAGGSSGGAVPAFRPGAPSPHLSNSPSSSGFPLTPDRRTRFDAIAKMMGITGDAALLGGNAADFEGGAARGLDYYGGAGGAGSAASGQAQDGKVVFGPLALRAAALSNNGDISGGAGQEGDGASSSSVFTAINPISLAAAAQQQQHQPQ